MTLLQLTKIPAFGCHSRSARSLSRKAAENTEGGKRSFAADASDLDSVYGSGHSNMLGKRSTGQSAGSIGAVSTLLSRAWSL